MWQRQVFDVVCEEKLTERKLTAFEQFMLDPYKIFNRKDPLFFIGVDDYVEVNKEKPKHVWEW
jgi:hypothetical protein